MLCAVNYTLPIPMGKIPFHLPHLALQAGESEPGSEAQPPAVAPMVLGVKGLAQEPTDM